MEKNRNASENHVINISTYNYSTDEHVITVATSVI